MFVKITDREIINQVIDLFELPITKKVSSLDLFDYCIRFNVFNQSRDRYESIVINNVNCHMYIYQLCSWLNIYFIDDHIEHDISFR